MINHPQARNAQNRFGRKLLGALGSIGASATSSLLAVRLSVQP